MKTFLTGICLATLLCGIASAQIDTAPIEQTFVLGQIDLLPETQTDVIQSLEPGFTKKVGGDLFIAKFGQDKFRYEYEGQWIEFEPLDHTALSLTSAANELYYTDYWPDANLRFTVREYGVKVDIILMSESAPTSYSFRVTKSGGWLDAWIKAPIAYLERGSVISIPVGVSGAETIIYTLPKIFEDGKLGYPVVIDPTFSVLAGNDDTYGVKGGIHDLNGAGFTSAYMGREYDFSTTLNLHSFTKWALNIPRASKITSSNISWFAFLGRTGTFNTYIARLVQTGSPDWKDSTAFNAANYADCSALLAISQDGTQVNWSPASWVNNTWNDSPDIAELIQEAVDSFAYDPLSALDKYVGLYVDDGDGGYHSGTTEDMRAYNTVEHTGSDESELDVTYDPWAEIMVSGGYRLDSDGLKYYGY